MKDGFELFCEIMRSAEEPAFKVGDWVKVLNELHNFGKGCPFVERDKLPTLPWARPIAGKRYEVIGVSDKQHDRYGYVYALKSEENTISYMHNNYIDGEVAPDALELTDPPKPVPKFKAGDKVVPVSKSIGTSFSNCPYWAVGKKKGFLFVERLLEEADGQPAYNCCNCLSTSPYVGNHYLESDLIPYVEPKPKEVKAEPIFKVGDRVRCIEVFMDNKKTLNKTGTILNKGDGDYYTIEFDENIDGNRGIQGYGKPDYCWCMPSAYFEIAKKESPPLNHCPAPKTITESGATFTFNGPATVCIIEAAGRKFKGIAKCAPDDTWNETTGKGWAGIRAIRKVLDATEKELKRK
ncbi:MAG: hypothetical protein PHX61_12735 [Alphaproteobacteria bacterium]|nr:hypothetical protein [Alphaproteobacteria bacterium]